MYIKWFKGHEYVFVSLKDDDKLVADISNYSIFVWKEMLL